jgi:hypothetical protein
MNSHKSPIRALPPVHRPAFSFHHFFSLAGSMGMKNISEIQRSNSMRHSTHFKFLAFGISKALHSLT